MMSIQSTRAYTDVSGTRELLFYIGRGIIQGSPMAGWIFALALDAALHMLQQVVVVPSSSS
eukprot:710374-Karenia_brevis.AAC.1